MKNKLKTVFISRLTEEEYNQIEPTVSDMNMKTLRWLSLLVAVMMLALVTVTFLPFFEAITVNRSAYLMMGISATVIYITAIFLLPKHPSLVKSACYLFLSTVIALSIYIGVFTNVEERGSTICVVLLAIPLLMTDSPIHISAFLTLSTIFFCSSSYMMKEESTFSADFLNCVCMLVISIAVNITQQTRKYRSIYDHYIIDQYNMNLIHTQKKQIEESKIAIMLSQIQPHFLYNALLVIQELCRTNPQEAEEATIEFSRFLRGNLDSLSTDAPIPFTKEIEHTKNYLALEQKRFGKKLRIEWSLLNTSFFVPALTLQPMVENAVRYGVTKKKGGGTVKISSEELEKEIEIIVSDDGMGFDPGKQKEDGRTHIGIPNVRKRLEEMCGGTLSIESIENEGTTVMIRIPKGGKEL